MRISEKYSGIQNVKVKRQSGFLARSRPSLANGRGGEDLIRKADRMRGPLCARIVQTVEGPSALPSLPLFSLLLFWAGPGTLLPSHNCHPTQSFVLRGVQGLSRSFPRTPGVHPSFAPSVFCHPPMFVSLLAFSRRVLSSFSPTRFLPRGPIPPFPRPLGSYLAEPRILFARVIVLRAYIPGETRAQSGISFLLRVLCSRWI